MTKAVLHLVLVVALVTHAFAYDVTKHEVDTPHKALIFKPSVTNSNKTESQDEEQRQFPAVLFAHGLCGPADLYESMLTSLASQGFVVMANQEQENCQSPTMWNPFSAFSALNSLRKASDGKVMVQNLLDEVDYLVSGEHNNSVDASSLALVGHSMGGGAVIDLAAKLQETRPGLVKGVVAIAPWNGIPLVKAPSSVVHEIEAPMLLFCSKTDQICPCSGPIGSATGLGESWMSYGVLQSAFYTSDNTWGGGVEAIFQNTNDDNNSTTLMEFGSGGHFALAGITKKQLEQLGRDMSGGAVGGFQSMLIDSAVNAGEINSSKSDARESGQDVLDYTIAFLKDHLFKNNQTVTWENVLQQAEADPKITVETN